MLLQAFQNQGALSSFECTRSANERQLMFILMRAFSIRVFLFSAASCVTS